MYLCSGALATMPLTRLLCDDVSTRSSSAPSHVGNADSKADLGRLRYTTCRTRHDDPFEKLNKNARFFNEKLLYNCFVSYKYFHCPVYNIILLILKITYIMTCETAKEFILLFIYLIKI